MSHDVPIPKRLTLQCHEQIALCSSVKYCLQIVSYRHHIESQKTYVKRTPDYIHEANLI